MGIEIFEIGTPPLSYPIKTLVDPCQREGNFKGLFSFLVRAPPAKIGTCPISEMEPSLEDKCFTLGTKTLLLEQLSVESTLWMICCKRNFSAHGDSSTVVVMNIMAVGRRSGTGLCNGCIDLPAGYFTDELRQAGLPLSLSLVFVTVFVFAIVFVMVAAS